MFGDLCSVFFHIACGIASQKMSNMSFSPIPSGLFLVLHMYGTPHADGYGVRGIYKKVFLTGSKGPALQEHVYNPASRAPPAVRPPPSFPLATLQISQSPALVLAECPCSFLLVSLDSPCRRLAVLLQFPAGALQAQSPLRLACARKERLPEARGPWR